jgi:hypothetical protein
VSVPSPSITGGIKPWDQAVSAHLPGWTCLWQDLDGLHVAAPPAAAPPTSVLWAWSGDGAMARLRLDGDTVHVALCAADVPVTAVEPWTPTDGRVRAVRFAPDTTAGLQLRLEQAVVAGVDCEAGPITFLRPARP